MPLLGASRFVQRLSFPYVLKHCSSGPCVSGCHDDLSIELRRWPVSERLLRPGADDSCTTNAVVWMHESSAPGRSRRSMQWHHETALAAWCDLR